jgi:hypothetical protein
MLNRLHPIRHAVLSMGICVAVGSAAWAQGFAGVLTQHNDLARTGQNLNETALTTTKVRASTFGKLFSYPVDNQVYAQPLYVPSVSIPGQGTHNVLYVATEGDSIYAFDADGLGPTLLWSVNFTNPAAGVNVISCVLSGLECGVYPNIGITGTPVIDPATNIMYVLVRTAETSSGVTHYFQRLHALDITTGGEMLGGPVAVTGAVPGTGAGSNHGIVTFNTLHENNRPGLVLANNNIYIGYSGSAHGWIMAYNAQTLAQTAIFNTTPNGVLGGVWASGNGLAVDSSGNLYASTGDGTFDANTGGPDYADTLLKLSPTLQVLDYFTPMDQACRAPLSIDLDLGSGGPMILPTQGGNFPDEVIEAGKGGAPCDLFPDGNYATPIYLVNRGGMGGYNSNQDQDIQTIEGTPHGYWSNPAYWQGPTSAFVYYSGVTSETGGSAGGDFLKAYSVTNGTVSASPASQTANLFRIGSTPSISANGTSNGILWAMERRDPLSSSPGNQTAILHAYSAANVATQLYSSGQTKVFSRVRDQMGCATKFQTPTIANGKVYVGTENEIDVFGLLPTTLTAPMPSVSVPCFTFGNQPVGTTSAPQTTVLTNLGPGTLTISAVSVQGLNPSEFAQTNTCGNSVALGASCSFSITFTPTIAKIPQQAYLQISDNAIGSALTLELVGIGK